MKNFTHTTCYKSIYILIRKVLPDGFHHNKVVKVKGGLHVIFSICGFGPAVLCLLLSWDVAFLLPRPF